MHRRLLSPALAILVLAVTSLSAARAQYAFVSLHPAGFSLSNAQGVSGGQQVGFGKWSDGHKHALVWNGSAASVIDLHPFLPADYTDSEAWSMNANGDIVGRALNSKTGGWEAALWKRVKIPGDFNGDGKVDLLFQNAPAQQMAVWYMNDITRLNDARVVGGAYVTPIQQVGWNCVGSGDTNGDGKPDCSSRTIRPGS
ncbi:MAG TPA: VCBS repeat-containing protein [Chthonomonadaceae bacterium]|nr:VCBS repeat-containing protein [Chthonomonadaceae bacterium]